MATVVEDPPMNAPVKDFFTGLKISTTPSVFEVGGRRVYILVRPGGTEQLANEPWTTAKNHRRFVLVNKEIDGTIGLEESVELEELNIAQDRWIQEVAPLPMEPVRELHDTLVAAHLAKASIE